ncbi:sigma-70 family RNA polymerase sigma factor [Actinophytocola sp. S1-96]|uniref:Sigma-70 family RNA polymerase sigma factor n=1 Tax=Actinophytocola gossypii TaxID=2812003 RepID=A0ABT2J9N8_9PSEU|nr:sigma-70 family RNA polymerase sigma factor [Actinophytocola gossypii]
MHQQVQVFIEHVSRDVDREELTSAGLLALVSTARSFEPWRGVPFPRYAGARLYGALVDELRSLDGPNPAARRQVRRMRSARARLTTMLGRKPTSVELSVFVGISVPTMATVTWEVYRTTVVHLQELVPGTLENLLWDEMPGPEEFVVLEEQVAHLRAAITALPPRLRLVVVEHFIRDRSMTSIARDLAVTRSRVSQLCAKAVGRLRDSLARLIEEPRN